MEHAYNHLHNKYCFFDDGPDSYRGKVQNIVYGDGEHLFTVFPCYRVFTKYVHGTIIRDAEKTPSSVVLRGSRFRAIGECPEVTDDY